ncbi:MAG: NADH-quinone oxidoreductase subunit N [Nitrospirota bacterium]|nr:NADH-quinone oxidoreductase subunit N [Nitrospirota bacterium]
MNMSIPMESVIALLPEMIVATFGCLVLLFDLVLPRGRKSPLAWFSLAGVALAAYATWRLSSQTISVFADTFQVDPYSNFFKLVFYVIVVLTVLMSRAYMQQDRIHIGEFYHFVLLVLLGMMVMVSATDLMTVYMGLELVSICLYVMAALKRYDSRSTEAGLKYFILGSFSSAVLLYGMSLVYGVTGTTNLAAIGAFLSQGETNSAATVGLILMVVGLAFKVAAAPFHMWAPDVYEGSPTPITAFMSVGPKAAAFAVTLRVLLEAFGGMKSDWEAILIVLAVLTMAVGAVLALVQTSIKRMLAYSSVGHAGYALIGVVVGDSLGTFAVMYYLAVYAVMNLGAFGVLIMLRSAGLKGEELDDYKGLSRTHPWAALFMLIFMFSLAGIPPTAGFIAKLYIFMSAVNAGHIYLAVAGALLAAVSAFYYIRVIVMMYMKEPEAQQELTLTTGLKVALVFSMLFVLILGVYPEPLANYAQLSILQF